jgi:site-specific DNA-methyltransferase (adenine-specific)
VKPYYEDELVTLYLGDCREVTNWLAANVLVTDPPYGIGWSKGTWSASHNPAGHDGIVGDGDTSLRDAALAAWGPDLPALVFGSLRVPYPVGWKRMLVFHKPTVGAGLFGNRMPWFTSWEPVFALGAWPDQTPVHDAVITTRALSASGYSGYATRYQHPHAKPVDVMETLIGACPAGIIADPFAGAGSTLVAARNLGRQALGVEIDERYAERAALRLCQGVLEFT